MDNNPDHREKMHSQEALCDDEDKATHSAAYSLKMFVVALGLANLSKTLAGSYVKSSITQIERRFELSSTYVGFVDTSFEMGNLLFLAVVSYFGAKLHRPRLIAAGCFIMSVGACLTGMTHFLMGRYKYDTVVHAFQNDTVNIAACVHPLESQNQTYISEKDDQTCGNGSAANMWIYILLGNALRGIGETPVTPLGISYVDDYAKAQSSPFYIASLQTIMLLGPMFGYLLGSYCATLYVDIGFVDMDSVTITPNDSRWVGAWWLGLLVSSAMLFISGIPFLFLPRSLPKEEQEIDKQNSVQETPNNTAVVHNKDHSQDLGEIAKGFLPSLKKLLCTPAYFLLLCGSTLKFNSLVGLFTFKAKYIEQQFGQSASAVNFLIGLLNLPAVASGTFLGGVIMTRYKLSVVSGAQLSLAMSFTGYLLMLLHFGTKCDNIPMAGLTVSYNGTPSLFYDKEALISECNRECSCSLEEWDPVCSDSGISYISPCMAGCHNSSGFGKNLVFQNCSCVTVPKQTHISTSAKLGQCPQTEACSHSFISYMAVSVLSSFLNAVGITPAYMLIIRCTSPELKSLALGIQTLVSRGFGGIPAPIYFGALIDLTCLKWSTKKCGGRGACRLYDSDMYRITFQSLITCLSGSSFFFLIAVIVLLKQQSWKQKREVEEPLPIPSKEIELQTSSNPTNYQTNANHCMTSNSNCKPKSYGKVTKLFMEVGDTNCVDRKEQVAEDNSVTSTYHHVHTQITPPYNDRDSVHTEVPGTEKDPEEMT